MKPEGEALTNEFMLQSIARAKELVLVEELLVKVRTSVKGLSGEELVSKVGKIDEFVDQITPIPPAKDLTWREIKYMLLRDPKYGN